MNISKYSSAIFLLLFSAIVFGNESKLVSSDWLALLHYKENFYGNYVSEANDPEFFLLGDKGRKDPAAELIKSLKTLRGLDSLTSAEFQCEFPARTQFLVSTFNLNIEKAHCFELQKFKDRLNAQSISILFASSFISSPASSFGHVYLKLNSGKDGNVLDHTINFGADVEGLGSFEVLSKGLTGYFKGYFTLVPHNKNLSLYLEEENRDLWEFRLNFSSEEIDRLIEHLWELKGKYFYYYFLTENCAYHLGELIKIAKPDFEYQKYLIVTPHQVVKELSKSKHLPGKGVYFPSTKSRIHILWKNLSFDDKLRFKNWVSNDFKDVQKFKFNEQNSNLIELAIRRMDYKHYKEQLGNDSLLSLRKKFLSLKKIHKVVSQKEFKGSDSPLLSHNSKTIKIGFKNNKSDRTLNLEFQPSFHGIMDDPEGFSDKFHLSLLNSRLQYGFEENDFNFYHFGIIDMFKYSPYHTMTNYFSWRVRMDFSKYTWFSPNSKWSNMFYLGGGGSVVPDLFGWVNLYSLAIAGYNLELPLAGFTPFLGVSNGILFELGLSNRLLIELDVVNGYGEGWVSKLNVNHHINFSKSMGLFHRFEYQFVSRYFGLYDLGVKIHF